MPEKTEKDIIYSLETSKALLEKCVRALILQGASLERDDSGLFAELASCMAGHAASAVSFRKTAASLLSDLEKAGPGKSGTVFLSRVKELESGIDNLLTDFSARYSSVKSSASARMVRYRDKINSLSEIPEIARFGASSASFLHSPEVIDISV